MKAHYRTRNGRLTFEIEGQSTKDVFRGIAEVQAIFEVDEVCGCCDSPHIQFRVRPVEDGGEYYELVCESCRATLTFGQTKKGSSLFPKRKDQKGNWLENGGWRVWRPESAAAPAPAPGVRDGKAERSQPA